LARDLRIVSRKLEEYGADVAGCRREYRASAESPIAANVLLYLGESMRTAPVLRRLLEQIRLRQCSQQYYASTLVTYFHTARLLARGLYAVASVREQILDDITSRQTGEGEIGSTFDTVISALTMMYYGAWGTPGLERAVASLAEHPMHESGWLPLHYCNDRNGVFKDGGAELTATFFLEALVRYRRNHYLPGA
jgi:hypothetical protein